MQMLSENKPRAKKQHWCCWCGDEIKAGHTYHRSTWVDGPNDLWEQKAHPVCLTVLNAYTRYFKLYDGDPSYHWPDVMEWADDEAYRKEQERERHEMTSRMWNDKWTVEGLVSL